MSTPDSTEPIFSPSDPELTAPEPVKEEPSFTVQDFADAVKDDGPPADAPVADLAAAVRRWHGILKFVGRQETSVAWRIGRALTYAQDQVKHGDWYNFLDREFPGLSKTTIWRYMQLYVRSPKRPPKKPLTDAYVHLGIVSNGRNTVEEYCQQLKVLVTKIAKLTRSAASLDKQRTALLDHIDHHDFADVAGMALLQYEAGLNYALQLLIGAVDPNPEINLFTLHGDAIGPQARLAVMENVGKSLHSPYDEHARDLIPADCIPAQLLNPELVARWDEEHRDAVQRKIRGERRARANYARSRIDKGIPSDDPINW